MSPEYITYDNGELRSDGDIDFASGLSRAFPEATSAGDSEHQSSVVYDLDMLSTKRPGPVLAVGYGNPLKTLVKIATTAEVAPLLSTSTDDKFRAFTFGGAVSTASVGKKFDPSLFTNEYAVLTAAENCGARTLLCATNAQPTDLLARECLRRDILLLVPIEGDKTARLWRRATPKGVSDDTAEIAEYRQHLEPIKWRRCAKCGLFHDNREVVANELKCPECKTPARLSTVERMALTFDEGSVEEWFADVEETNALDFPDFDAVIERARKRSGADEGVITGRASIEGFDVAFCVMEPEFIMGSMGHVVGERVAATFERATELGLPVVAFCTSGGARMQEGLVSLMQMAKTAAAVEHHSEAGLLYISVLADPTTGGVTASFATLGDIILAEPGANIGFAGRRVIRDTIKQALPDDFQTAEFALEHGLIDAIVKREDMRATLARLLSLHNTPKADDRSKVENNSRSFSLSTFSDNKDAVSSAGSYSVSSIESSAVSSAESSANGATEPHAANPSNAQSQPPSLDQLTNGLTDLASGLASGLTELAGNIGAAISEQTTRATKWWKFHNKGIADIPYVKPARQRMGAQTNSQWESVQLARNTSRPTSAYYINTLFDDFFELHGDRLYADDGAIIGGIGRIGGRVVTVISEEKGADLNQRIARNFGCPQPEGYRKAMRLMDEAQKFGRPVICFVDTQGAYCGKEAEERGIGTAIAESLAKLSALTVPVVAVVIGEGGSGGALALAVANKVAMQENAVYSVLSPEGFASILWKDGSRAPEAAEVMKVGASDALEIGIIEDVIVEGAGPAHENPDQAAAALWLYLNNALEELSSFTPEELKSQRYNRFRNF